MGKVLFASLFLIILLIGISASCEKEQIDINKASKEKLDELYGIGPSKAEAIINARPFENVNGLINVVGIGEITLNKIKDQNLACVYGQEEENIQNEEYLEDKKLNEEELKNEEEPEAVKITSKEIQDITPEEVKTIILTPKDIKSESDKEELNRNKLAIYGLVIFCVLLVFLFMIKKDRKEKNEFG